MTDHSSQNKLTISAGDRRSSASKANSRDPRARLICVDANLKTSKGKAFQLANAFAAGARQLSMHPVLATHIDFAHDFLDDGPQCGERSGNGLSIVPAFHVDNLAQWSLSVDGRSSTRRDSFGKPFGGTSFQNAWMQMAEKMVTSDRCAEKMLDQWSTDFAELLWAIKPKQGDVVLMNQCNDFTLLALASALRRTKLDSSLRIEAIFHAPIFYPNQPDRAERSKQFASQLNDCLSLLRPHQVNLHATSPALATQFRVAGVRQVVHSISYPITRRQVPRKDESGPAKILIAGEPQKNRRQTQIVDLISGIHESYLKPNRFRLSTRPLTDDDAPESWQRIMPPSLHRPYAGAVSGDSNHNIEIVDRNLQGEAYHTWLDSADVGLFLYDPAIYAARCSSVLLNLLARGIPVIVPDKTTLADEVREAGGNGSAGFVYRSRNDIPALLDSYSRTRNELHDRCLASAETFTRRHNARNTLLAMGLNDQGQSQRVA